MILNERQYRTTQKKLRDTESDAKTVSSGKAGLPSDDQRVALASLNRFAAQLRGELSEYEALRSGAIPVLPISDLQDLPLALIRARIAQQLTQAELADRLRMKEQQLQRYEVTRYGGASLERLTEIAKTLGVKFSGSAVVDPPPTQHIAIWRKPLILMTLQSLRIRWHRPAEGALELQKLLVNVDVALRSHLRFHAFEFEPYKLGPFDPFIEDDIERLAVLGMVQKFVDTSAMKGDQVLVAELRTVPIGPTPKAEDWLIAFRSSDTVAPQPRKQQIWDIVDTIIAEYGALGVSDLMARTYEEHREFTTRSEIREEMARRAERRS